MRWRDLINAGPSCWFNARLKALSGGSSLDVEGVDAREAGADMHSERVSLGMGPNRACCSGVQ